MDREQGHAGAAPVRTDAGSGRAGRAGETSADVREAEVAFPSACQGVQSKGTLWLPTGGAAPRALVQVVHGMAEHAGRYADLARHLVGLGYAVLAHDHASHGRSAPSPAAWGLLPARSGANALVEDVFRAYHAALPELAGTGADPAALPHVLLGHSMGSFVVRLCAARADAGLAGLVVCGTGELPAAVSRAGNLVARAVCAMRGQSHRSSVLDRMGAGGYSSKVEGATGPYDWLSHDRDNVRAYEQDPACGFMFSAGGYAALTRLTGRCSARACYRSTPDDLPVLVIAGEDDPVGDFGRGPALVARRYRQAGLARVELSLYPQMRHEILNEGERARTTVWRDLRTWLEAIS